jgi:hypothetical protein
VNASAFGAVQIMAAEAFGAQLVRDGVFHHMVGTDQLTVVGRIDDPAPVSALPLPFPDLQDDAGRQLVIEIIQMTHIRLEIIQNFSQLNTSFLGIDGL